MRCCLTKQVHYQLQLKIPSQILRFFSSVRHFIYALCYVVATANDLNAWWVEFDRISWSTLTNNTSTVCTSTFFFQDSCEKSWAILTFPFPVGMNAVLTTATDMATCLPNTSAAFKEKDCFVEEQTHQASRFIAFQFSLFRYDCCTGDTHFLK